MGLLRVKEAEPELRRMREDDSSLVIMVGNNLTSVRVKELWKKL